MNPRPLPLLALLFAAAAPARGLDVPITDRDCVYLALQNNLELQTEALSPRAANARIQIARGALEPAVDMSADWEDITTPIDRATAILTRNDSTESELTRYRGSLTQTLPTGLSYDIAATADNNENTANRFQSAWDTSFGIALAQPLLRGFGPQSTLADIRIARKDREAADAAFEFRIGQIVTDTLFAYYDLVFARDDLAAREASLALADQLLADNQSRYEAGVMSPLDVTQARTEVAARQEELIRAQQFHADTENRLKRLIFQDITPWLAHRLVPAAVARPVTWANPVFNIQGALRRRADLRERHAALAAAGIELAFAKNELLPTVDARGSYTLVGLENSLDESYERAVDAYDRVWSVGVVVRVPLGMSTERGRKNLADTRKREEILRIKALEQDIIVQVDNAARNVLTQEQRVKTTREARYFAEETLDAETEKLRAGASTTFVVTQLQRDLKNARSAELRAVADWYQAVADLARVEGRALEVHGIQIDNSAAAPVPIQNVPLPPSQR